MTFHLRWFLVPLAVALLTISVPTGAGHAALILDQVFDPGPNPSVASGISLLQKAQTFTVGLAGTLAQVDVDILRNGSPAGPLLFDVRATTAGGAPIESNATTLPQIIEEMLLARNSERQGRMIDHDEAGSMEQKKREGYF